MSFVGSGAIGGGGGAGGAAKMGQGGVGDSSMSYRQYRNSSWVSGGGKDLSRKEWNNTSMGQKNAFSQYVGTAENPGPGWNPSTDNPYDFKEWQGSTFNTGQYDWVSFPNDGKTY